PLLRQILRQHEAGDAARARLLSSLMSALIDHLFKAAQPLPFGNAFSNANRAVDHLRAHGAAWRAAPLPLTRSGNVVPASLVEEAEFALLALPGPAEAGYLGGTSIAKKMAVAMG